MVAVGFTLVDPLACVEVNVPGVIAIEVAPLVAQLNVLLEPELMLVGFAANELIVGLLVAVTVTVAVDVTEPVALVAVNVYVVVVPGLTLVDPLAWEDVNVPGVMEIDVAPLVDQLSVLLVPELTLVGFALNDAMLGLDPPPEDVVLLELVEAAQPVR